VLGCWQKTCQNQTASNYYGEIWLASILWVKNLCHPHKPKPLVIQTFSSDLQIALGLCISLVIHKVMSKSDICLVIIMVKYNFYCSTFNYWSKNLSLTQTQAIAYTSIPSGFQSALGLFISLVIHKSHVRIRQLVFTMVKYIFDVAPSILIVRNLSPTQTQAMGYTNIPSDLQLDFGLCISLFIHKKHAKFRHIVITMVKYVVCWSTFNSCTKKPVTHTNP